MYIHINVTKETMTALSRHLLEFSLKNISKMKSMSLKLFKSVQF
jgi:hypothetical protein